MSKSRIEVILCVVELVVVSESVIFPSSIVGTTMQDGGKRERRNCHILLHHLVFSRLKIRDKEKKR